MKIFITLFLAIFIFSIQAFSQSEKTIIKSVPMDGSGEITLALSGDVELEEWDKDFVRIVATVKLENFSEGILKRLVEVGRYDIQSTQEGVALIISMPKVAKTVTIKGIVLKENFSYQVSVPKNIIATVKSTAALKSL